MTCRLYLITPPAIELATFKDTLARALDAGDVGCVQLRLKNTDGTKTDTDDIRRAAETLLPVVQSRDVAFVLNDDAKLATEMGFDGVHVGQDDFSAKDARTIVGKDAIVGVSCYDSRHLAMLGAEQGADYVAFGAFFPTRSKIAKTHAEPEILEAWSTMTNVPCVAIGGINLENCAPLVRAGADFLAVISAVWNHPDGVDTAVRAFNAIFQDPANLPVQ